MLNELFYKLVTNETFVELAATVVLIYVMVFLVAGFLKLLMPE